MPKEAIIRHLAEVDNPQVKVNCATATLYALLGDINPRAEFVDAAYEGTFDIVPLAVVAAIELYEQKDLYCHLSAPQDMSMTEYIRETKRHIKIHPYQKFVGMIVSSQFKRRPHVFAITGLHKEGKLSKVDTAFIGLNDQNPYMRKTGRLKIDQIAKPLPMSDYPAVAIFSEPLDSPHLQTPEAQREIQATVNGWYNTASSFVWFAHYGQYQENIS